MYTTTTPPKLDVYDAPPRVVSLSQGKEKLKLMVANRGEIAVRVLRAGRDSGFNTLGIFAEEDHFGGHLASKMKSRVSLIFCCG